MELKDTNKTDKFIRAKKQVDELKGFYIHLMVYILVNIFITTITVIARINGGRALERHSLVLLLSLRLFFGV